MEIRKQAAGPSPSEGMKVRDTFILPNVFPPKWAVKMSTVQAINCGENQFLRRVKGWGEDSFDGRLCAGWCHLLLHLRPQTDLQER